MPYDGSGTFTRSYTWTTDAANSIPITASRMDADSNDFASGLTLALTRDGQGKPSVDLNWNGKKITNLGDATSATDALNRQSGDARYGQLGAGNTWTSAQVFSGTVTGNGAVSFTSTFTVSGVSTFTAGAQTTPVAVTFSATAMTVNCALSNVFTTTFTANVTVAPTLSNPGDGQTINWFITQDGTGSRTMTWPSSFVWVNGAVGVLSTTAGAVDCLVATYRSATSKWYCALMKGFA